MVTKAERFWLIPLETEADLIAAEGPALNGRVHRRELIELMDDGAGWHSTNCYRCRPWSAMDWKAQAEEQQDELERFNVEWNPEIRL